MELFKRKSFAPRDSELAAIEALPSDAPFIPDNLDITVFFGGHTTEYDFKSLQTYIRQSDIFMREFAFWSPEEVQLLSRVSQGDKTASKLFLEYKGEDSPFTAGTLSELLGSNIRTSIFDIPASDARAEEIDSHFVNFRIHASSLVEAVTPDYDETIGRIITLADKEADIESYREDIMLRSIGPRLQALIENDAELRQVSRPKVLIQLGTYHTYFYHHLRKLVEGNDTISLERVFYEPKPIIFDHFDRITRADRSGIHLSSEQRFYLAERALGKAGLILGVIETSFTEEEQQTGILNASLEELVERITVDEIKMFHNFVVGVQQEKGHQPKIIEV